MLCCRIDVRRIRSIHIRSALTETSILAYTVQSGLLEGLAHEAVFCHSEVTRDSKLNTRKIQKSHIQEQIENTNDHADPPMRSM